MREETMKTKSLRVLIVGGSAKAPDLLQSENTEARSFEFHRVTVGRLEERLQYSREGGPHLILLDISLPEADLMKALSRIRKSGCGVPVLVLPQEIDSCSMVNASFKGTVGTRYAAKFESDPMTQSLQDALRRKAFQAELSRLALSDELTGLYNRRGFLIHGSEYMKRASRLKQHLIVFYADLDNLKQINDQFGHHEGDLALVKIAEVFKKTFRQSDIISRFGGDEFAALVVDDFRNGVDTITRRLRRNMYDLATNERHYNLSLSFGTAQYLFKSRLTLQKLLDKADQSLYKQKRIRHENPAAGSLMAFPGTMRTEAGTRASTSRTPWLSVPEQRLQRSQIREC
jgi:two-component system, cell cycle response regulator